MGGFDIQKREVKLKKSSSKAKPKAKRPGIRIDMTPMVDIAFLLLIFYMVTTVFSMPQSLELNLPPKNDDKVIIRQSRLLELWVNAAGELFWIHQQPSMAGMELPERVSLSDLQKLLIEKNSSVDKLVTVLKIDPDSRYEVMIRIIDDIQIVERIFKQIDPGWSYRFTIDDISEWEIEQMAKAAGIS